MIPRNDIVDWSAEHPWPEFEQVEQDLLLSKAICEISNDPLLGEELALRGGTALHKLFMPMPLIYSEDLDYVRIKEGGIGEIMTRLTSLGEELGFSVKTRMGMFPKVLWRFTSENGIPSRLKIEINTYERKPICGFTYMDHEVESPYYRGNAHVRTFEVEELIATKIRALYQKSKGRDLYDIWLSLKILGADEAKIIDIFPAYEPENIRVDDIISNLEEKLSDKMFLGDVQKLIRDDAPEYDALSAGEFVIDKLISKI